MQLCTKLPQNWSFDVKKSGSCWKTEGDYQYAHVRSGIQIPVGNTPFLQLASFEDIFTQRMGLEMRVQNYPAKQSFCVIVVAFGRCSGIIW